jgi:ATP synthase F1 gamma subunit
MIPIVKLKRNIEFNKSLGEIIEVMKLTATLQYNQFRSVKEPFGLFGDSLESAVSSLPQGVDQHGFFSQHSSSSPRALLLVSSDSGFMGELSTILTNRYLEIMQKSDLLIAIGQQGAGYLRDLNLAFQSLPSIPDRLEFAHINSVRDYVINLFLEKKISGLTAVYPRFVNLTSQLVEVELLFPLAVAKRQEEGARVPAPRGQEVLIEPSLGHVQRRIAELLLTHKLYQIFWSSKLAEYAARIMHLESSGRELMRIDTKNRLEYFKFVHGLSDKTIREIFAARLKLRVA